MAQCEICERTSMNAKRLSMRGTYVTRRFLRKLKTNVKSVKIVDGQNKRKASVCTSCLRSNKVTRAV